MTGTAVRAAALLDGLGGPPMPDCEVLVEDGEIRGIGTHGEFADTTSSVIDLGNRFLLPGLIDAHTHFYGVPSTALYAAPFEDPAYRAVRAAGEAKRLLEAGFTAARCCGSSIGPALRRAIEDGHVPGPRLMVAGDFVCNTAGTFDPNSRFNVPLAWGKNEGMFADGPDAMRELVRRRVRQGATLIKIGLSKGDWTGEFPVWGTDPVEQELAMSPEEIHAVVTEARRHRLRVSAHCIGDIAVRAAVEFGIDTIEHGFGIGDETRALLVEHRSLVVTTLCAMNVMSERGVEWGYTPRQMQIVRRHVDVQRADFATGLAAGVRYALGTDLVGAPTHPLDTAGREFELAVAFGMDPAAALVAGTAVAADALGLADAIGTVEVGKYADFVATPEDPLADIGAVRSVDFVMKGGEVVVDAGARDRDGVR